MDILFTESILFYYRPLIDNTVFTILYVLMYAY